jgi:zinc resistance-associated protein
MYRRFLTPLTIAVVSAFALPAVAATANEPNGQQGMERMQHWAADREMVLDAKLAGMKAELKLNPDQEKLWGPFETAVQNAAKARMEDMQQMMGARDERMSPIDRLDAMANHLSKAAADVKQVADTAKPLYASLDETQKHEFATLGRMLMPERARFAMEMMRHRWNEGEMHE